MPDPLAYLIDNNRRWVAQVTAEDPEFFTRLKRQQRPEYMWIGCCDSRVPANEIIGLLPGEVFVHRNVGNVVMANDLNCMSAVQYAVEVLGIRSLIVCGHYNCGAVNASLEESAHGLIDYWIWPIKEIQRRHPWLAQVPKDRRGDVTCELNVLEQVANLAECKVLRRAWSEGKEININGWIYDVGDGQLRETLIHLDRTCDNASAVAAAEDAVRTRAGLGG